MNGQGKIRSSHRSRTALVYLRQSTMLQVRDHTESTARQYGLVASAVALGWPEQNVTVIDADLGVSARFGAERGGFRDLVAKVCLGEVGAVFGLEVSRLARSSAEFARLLELARLTDTLVIDGDGIYDLADINDRLLLGLKGSMSEAELHLLAGRLHGARRAAAQRGQLRLPVPIGLVHDDDGLVIMDPDERVRQAVAEVFAAFARTGSAYGVVAEFADRTFPRRVFGGVWDGQLRWGRLTHIRVLEILKNPAYAGAYAFGRSATVRRVHPDGRVTTAAQKRSRDQWPVLITDHHEGYVSWQQFLDIEAKLVANRTNTGARPAREGLPLCQGIIWCGACGYPMSTRYRRSDGSADYVCSRARCDATATANCHSITATTVDAVIEQLVVRALSVEQIELALAAASEVHDRHTRSRRACELAVEQARYEADRAERAFHQVEPENRLVARSLETRWETRLAALAQAEAALVEWCQTRPASPDPDRLRALAADLPRLWNASTTAAKDRKRLLRTLIADVTIRDVDFHQAHIGIRWHTGAISEVTADRRANRNPQRAVTRVQQLVGSHDDSQIADILNVEGLRTGKNRPFTASSIRFIRAKHRIGSTRSDPTLPGEITVPEAARILNIHENSIYQWVREGRMMARQERNRRWCIPWNPQTEAYWRQYVAESSHLIMRTTPRNETEEAV